MLENLDRLKVFYHVFSQGSVGGAAQSLFVTQPAVSQAIRKLESELKTMLFVRQHRRLIPTEAGKRLFAVVKPFMSELDECLQGFDHAHNEPYGELRVGAPSEFGKAYITAVMAAFRRKHPGVTFYLEFGSTEVLERRVKRAKLDLALVDTFLVQDQPTGAPSLFHFEPVFKEALIMACSRKYHEENIRDEMSLDQLAALDFIEYTRQTRTVEYWFRHHFGTIKVQPKVVMTVNNHDAVTSAMKHHSGLGLLASHLVERDLKSGEIIPIRTSKEDIVNRISLIHLQDKIPTLSEKVFRQFLVRQLRQLGF